MENKIKRTNTNALANWDITMKCNDPKNWEIEKNNIIEKLWKFCKKWGFQLEKGEEKEYIHWQLRINLSTKMRLFAFEKYIHQFWPGCHISPTTEECKNDYGYVTKELTRIQGPWIWENELKNKISKIPKEDLPIDLKMIESLWPWQEEILRISKEMKLNFRKINWVYDPAGAKGKSTLIRWCMANGIGYPLMIGGGYKDMLRMAWQIMNSKSCKIFFIDLPRAYIEIMGKKEKCGMISAIETIKSGYAYDERYEWKDKIFDPPQIWVFSNWAPEESLLSKDRWNVFKITGNMEDPKNIKLTKSTIEEIKTNNDMENPKSETIKLKIIKHEEIKSQETKKIELLNNEIIPIKRNPRRETLKIYN